MILFFFSMGCQRLQTSGVLTIILVLTFVRKMNEWLENIIVVSRSSNLSFNLHTSLSEMCAAHHSALNPTSQKDGVLGKRAFPEDQHQPCGTSVLSYNVLKRQFPVGQESCWLLLCCLGARHFRAEDPYLLVLLILTTF